MKPGLHQGPANSPFWRRNPLVSAPLSLSTISCPPLTCYKTDGGAIAAAQLWIAPRHHGYPEVVVPGWQQVGYSLNEGEKNKETKG